MMLCIPITGKNEAEALERIRRAGRLAGCMELRMDAIAGGNVKRLIREIRTCFPAAKIIVTNRRVGDGSEPVSTAGEKKRFTLLGEAVALGADCVDVELDADAACRKGLRALIHRYGNRTTLIVSHHDFSGTPSARRLREIFRAAVRAGAGIVKIVTVARSAADNLKVLSLIPYGRRQGRETIAFCMGEQGRISRVAAPYIGSHLTFASLEKGAESAPGQFTAAQMKRIFRSIPAPADGGEARRTEKRGRVERRSGTG